MEQMVWQTTQQKFTESPRAEGRQTPCSTRGLFCFEDRYD